MTPDQPVNEPVFVPDSWYAIAPSSAVSRSRPLSLERLGRRWVAWRDAFDGGFQAILHRRVAAGCSPPTQARHP